MKIEKQNDGSTKVVFEDDHYFFVEKGKDPIDSVIDIGLEQKKIAAAIEDKYSISGILKPEAFLFTLYLDYNAKAWCNPQNKNWYKSVITGFNHEIKNQQLYRERKVRVGDSFTVIETGTFDDGECGKYFISMEDTVPEILIKIPETQMDDNTSDLSMEIPETPEELEERVVATTLLNFIYCLVDIRKIEARISELKGLCAYLKIIAPDEFSAYCALGDKIGFNAELDVDRYYELLKQLT